jgi:hypothetical protein
MGVVRLMKSVSIHPIPICEFIRGRYEISILPIDVEEVTATIDSDSTLQDAGQLEARAWRVVKGSIFYGRVGAIVGQGRLFYTDRR